MTTYHTRTLKDSTWYLKIEGCNQQLIIHSKTGVNEWDYQILVPRNRLRIYTAEYKDSTEAEFRTAFQKMEAARGKMAKIDTLTSKSDTAA